MANDDFWLLLYTIHSRHVGAAILQTCEAVAMALEKYLLIENYEKDNMQVLLVDNCYKLLE